MKKDLNYYLNLNYPITLSQDEENGKVYFEAEIPDLPGCGAQGETIEEALEKLDEAKQLWLEVSLERNLPIPEPASEDEFSGKFLLRIPARLHMQLTKVARKESMSLNQYIRSLLERQLDINELAEKIAEKLAEKWIAERYLEVTVNPEAQPMPQAQSPVAGVTTSPWNMYEDLEQ